MSMESARQPSEEQQEMPGGDLESLLSLVDLAMPSQRISDTNELIEASANNRLSAALNFFLTQVLRDGLTIEKLKKQDVDRVIDQIDHKLSEQISLILHHPLFQEMESTWRGLKQLVDNTNYRANIELNVLDVSKEDLREDLEDAPELSESGLFYHAYRYSYDQAGGEPVAAIIGNYYFDHSDPDVAMLRNISKVSASCHAPFISSVSSQIFGLSEATTLHKIKDMEDHFLQSEYIRWRDLRESEDSRYLGLCFPRFMLRAPYDQRITRYFNFTEQLGRQPDHNKFLWGNAAWAFASRMVDSFAQHGWCVNIRGPQTGGVVPDLPIYVYEDHGEQKTKIPTEVAISDRVELELSESGIIPLTYYKNSDYACFFSALSVQKPARYSDPDVTASAKMAANLPYLFLASRLSHYLKVIQRENIGAAREKADLQKELDRWIKKLVTQMPGAGAELRAARPLREAEVEVNDIPESPGWYDVRLRIKPHFQVEGVNVELSMVSKMPKSS